MTRSIPAANQPTEDENGGARRNRAKELQKAYLATCIKKVKEEEEALRSFRPRATEHIVDTIKGNVLNNNLAAGRASEACVRACVHAFLPACVRACVNAAYSHVLVSLEYGSRTLEAVRSGSRESFRFSRT